MVPAGYVIAYFLVLAIILTAIAIVSYWAFRKLGYNRCKACNHFVKVGKDGLCKNCRMHHAAALAHERHPAMQQRHP